MAKRKGNTRGEKQSNVVTRKRIRRSRRGGRQTGPFRSRRRNQQKPPKVEAPLGTSRTPASQGKDKSGGGKRAPRIAKAMRKIQCIKKERTWASLEPTGRRGGVRALLVEQRRLGDGVLVKDHSNFTRPGGEKKKRDLSPLYKRRGQRGGRCSDWNWPREENTVTPGEYTRGSDRPP